jgi:hypothetical protein
VHVQRVPVAAHVALRTGRATTAPAKPPRRAPVIQRHTTREFAAAAPKATTARAEFRPTATTTVVRAGSPEPSRAAREFASEFGD